MEGPHPTNADRLILAPLSGTESGVPEGFAVSQGTRRRLTGWGAQHDISGWDYEFV
jgi:hypothetical protein